MSRVLHYFHVTHTRSETHLNPLARTQSWILVEWSQTEKIIDSLALPPERTKVYQDSLPDYSDHGYQAVDHIYSMETAVRLLEWKLQRLDSPNDRILIKLVRKGCRLVATENIKHMEIVAYLWKEMPPDREFLLKKLQGERDPFIAHRINSTLQRGDTGILFLGKDHQIADKLDMDIEMHHYFDNIS